VILALAAFVAISVGTATWRVLRRRITPVREVEPPDVVLQEA
jgi:zinc transport system permease protein